MANTIQNKVATTASAEKKTMQTYIKTMEGEIKKAHYACVQSLAEEFRKSNGSIICREILKNPPSDPNPTPRTQEFYQQRPCVRMVMEAVRIMEQYIEAHPVER